MRNKKLLLLISLLLLLGIATAAFYHVPISTGDTSGHSGRDTFDASGVAWYDPAQRWLLLNQTAFEVYYPNGTYISLTNSFSCNSQAGDHEGVTTINLTSDVIIIQTEGGAGNTNAGICIADADDIIDGSTLTISENFAFPANDADCGNGRPVNGGSEGVAFIPDESLIGVCRYDGFLVAQDQAAGYFYKYCINLTTSTLNCIERIAKPTCDGDSETPALDYDYREKMLYVQSDNGDAVCVIDPFNFAGGYVKTIIDPVTNRPTSCRNTFEGFAIGNGNLAYADDGTGGSSDGGSNCGDSYQGLWLFNDNLTYPSFYNFQTSPSNNTAFSLGATYQFNATINSTNSTAGIEFNGVNYSVTNISSVYNSTISNLGAGTYSYYWWAWGNGTGVENRGYTFSSAQSYTVAQASSSINATINGTQNNFSSQNGTATQNIYLNATNITGYGRGLIYFNGSLINNGTFPIFNVTNLTIGFYNITFVFQSNQNYSSSTEVWWVNITSPPGPDTTSPIVTINSPSSGAFYKTSNLPLNFTISLDEQGSARYSLNGGANNVTMYNSTGGTIGTIFNATNSSIADGTYTLRIYANDTSGNQNLTSSVSFTFDSTNPSTNLTFPLNTTYTSLLTALNYTVSDTNLQACWYSTNSGVTNTSITCGTNLTGLTSSQGSNIWRIYANDSAGNSNLTSQVTFFIDSIFPTISFVNPTPSNLSYQSSTSITLNVSSSDTNLANITIRLYNSSRDLIRNNFSTSSPFNITHLSLPEGIYYFNATSTDSLNNQNNSETRQVTIDTTSPVVNLQAPANATSSSSATHSFNATFSDNSQLANATLYLYNATALVNTTSRGLSGTSGSINLTVTLPHQGNFTWNYLATDNASNSAYNSTNFTITYSVTDLVYPLFTAFNQTPGNNTAYSQGATYRFNVTISNTNATAGIEFNGINYTVTNLSSVFNSTLSNLGAGTYSYYWWAWGNGSSHNYNISSTQSYTVAQASQSITPLLNGNNANLAIAFPQQVNASFSGTNQTALTIRINGTSINISQNYTIGAGSWIVNFSAVSNQNYSLFTSFLNLTISQASSSINGTINGTQGNFSAVNGSSTQNILINLTNTTGYGSGTISINGTTINSGTFPLSNRTNLSIGFYNITFTFSSNQNYSSSTEVFWVNISLPISDTTPPQVNITSPSAANYSTSQMYFNVTLNEEGTCNYTLNSGATNYTMSSTDNLNFNASNGTIADGSYTVRFYCQDSSSNINNSQTRTFGIGTVFPIFYSLTDNTGTLTDSGIATFNVSINNTNGTAFLEINGVNYSATNLSSNFYNVSVSLSGAGTYSYYWGSWGNASIKNYNITSSQSYTIAASSSEDNNGGGGGGGGGSGAGGALITGKTYALTRYQMSKEYSTSIKKNDKIEFAVNSITHTLSIKSLTLGSVTIIIQSTPQEATLFKGESQSFDLTDDSIDDILIKLNDINGSQANFSISSISEVPIEENQSNLQPDNQELEDNSINLVNNTEEGISGFLSKYLFYSTVIPIIIFLIIFVIVLIKRHKKHRYYHYGY